MNVRILLLAGVAAMAALSGGCANKTDGGSSASLLGGDGSGGYGRGRAMPGTPEDFKSGARDMVYFSSDSSDLTPEAEQTLMQQARWLQQYPQHQVMIEGHADERGTREYNLALGARRAQSVRNFLSRQGVQHARMRTISYGKERPVAVCDDISCWSQNRRAQTVLGGAAISSR
jgi:peptidoglycan-associated lipoprotein